MTKNKFSLIHGYRFLRNNQISESIEIKKSKNLCYCSITASCIIFFLNATLMVLNK
ncbi:MAG: hypothetical protein ACJAVF_003862 [Paraglaciecola sp.]